MRSAIAQVSALFTVIAALVGSPCAAQTRVTSLEDLRRTLAAGDVIAIVPADGPPLAGRLTRIGEGDLDLRVAGKPMPGERVLTLPLAQIRSLERRRDSVRNGAAIGAGVGAGVGAAMFAYAFAVDRNEMDEWAPLYGGTAAICTGIGALIGWAIDAARSKPHIRFEPSAERKPAVSVKPAYLRGRGVGLAVTWSGIRR